MAVYFLDESNVSDNQPEEITESYMTEKEAIAYMESIKSDEFDIGLFESNMNILDREIAMFEAMLNMDFMDAINNNVGYVQEAEIVTANNNAKKAALSSNIATVVSNSKEAIRQSGAKANDEALTLLTSDKKTYKKYVSALRTYKNLDGFVGVSNFAFPTDKTARYIDMVGDLSDITRAYRKAISNILDARSRDKIRNVMQVYSIDIDVTVDDSQKRTEKAFTKEAKWNPSRQDVMMIVRFINNPTRIACSIAEEVRNCNDQLTRIQKIANNAYTACETKDTALYTVMIDAVYHCSALAARTAVQRFNMFKDLTIREIAAYRRAAMICGRYASNKKEGLKESVESQELSIYAIGESSDEYVFGRFENL